MSGLFDPIRIGKLELGNRVVMAPMLVGWATTKGEVTDRLIEHYVARAKGGVGLIITEACCPDPKGRATKRDLLISDDNRIAAFAKLAEAVQAHGSKIVLQLGHAGANAAGATVLPKYCNSQPLVPSNASKTSKKTEYKVLTTSEVKGQVLAFAAAANRAKVAGFDGIEVLAGHGELINQFLSPYYNRRTDEYGGSSENRMRFLTEIIAEAKKRVGDDFPFLVRFSADEYLDGGLSLEDTQPLAKRLEEVGIHLLDVSATSHNIQKAGPYEGWLVYLAEAIKQVVSVPVITVGRISTPKFADSIVREEKADMVALGRGLLYDANWTLKAAESLGVKLGQE